MSRVADGKRCVCCQRSSARTRDSHNLHEKAACAAVSPHTYEIIVEGTEHQEHPRHNKSDGLYKLNRADQVILLRLRTGQTRLNLHPFNKMKMGQLKMCPLQQCCNDQQPSPPALPAPGHPAEDRPALGGVPDLTQNLQGDLAALWSTAAL